MENNLSEKDQEWLREVKIRILEYLSKERSEKSSYYWNLETLVITEDELKWEKFKSDPDYIPNYKITCTVADKNKNDHSKEFIEWMLTMRKIAENCTCQPKNEDYKGWSTQVNKPS